MEQKDIERFWSKVDKSGDCWEWVGYLNEKGYGKFRLNNKLQRAHRISYALKYGAIPEGMLVCHRCDNPKCVNPEHLFIGTTTDNARDSISKGRRPKMKHPSLSFYRSGCRCFECKELKRLSKIEYNERVARFGLIRKISTI